MKVLLTHGYFLSNDPAEAGIMKPYPPVGLLYLSSWLKKEKIENEIFDTTFSSHGKLHEYLINNQPGMIGIYSTLMTKMQVLKIIHFIRQSKSLESTRIIIGGPDARQNAENYLDSGADVVVPGEGELTLTDLVKFFSGRLNGDLKDIKGIVFKNNKGEVIDTGERAFLDMDSLPFPGLDQIEIHQYLNTWKLHHGFTSMILNTMRGCPFSCNWCSKSIYGISYRRRKAELVADEIEWLKTTYNPDQIWFTDDVFTINRKWLQDFNKEMIERKLTINYECISRTDCIDEEIIDLLKSSGCKKIWIGAESGSQAVLDFMNRKTDIKETVTILRKIKKKGISTGTFIMLGYPGEMKVDIHKTLDYLRQADPDEFTISMVYPIKGTKFFSDVEKDFLNPFDWNTMNEREIKFKKSYSYRYYNFAIRYISNTMASRREPPGFKKLIYLLKSVTSMVLSKLIN